MYIWSTKRGVSTMVKNKFTSNKSFSRLFMEKINNENWIKKEKFLTLILTYFVRTISETK